jgi:hypothetical protein
MKTRSTKSHSKRSAASRIGPAAGAAGVGVSFDPANLAEEKAGPSGANTRPAPAPGVPMSDTQYEKLKREAETARKPPSRHSQEDPAAKK